MIISDRDPKFLGEFWKGLWKALSTKLAFSTAYHPQTDGQSEVENQTVEIALRYHVAEIDKIELGYDTTPWTDVLPALQFQLTTHSSTP